MSAVIRREAAKRDLLRHFVYLAEHASIEIADRFVAGARMSFRQLSEMPLMGASAGILSGQKCRRQNLARAGLSQVSDSLPAHGEWRADRTSNSRLDGLPTRIDVMRRIFQAPGYLQLPLIHFFASEFAARTNAESRDLLLESVIFPQTSGGSWLASGNLSQLQPLVPPQFSHL